VSHRLKACLLVLCLAGVLSACEWGGAADTEGAVSGQHTTSTPRDPTIKSSLEGLTVLPTRIRWSAATSVPPERVEEVQFLVDGDRWWEDSMPPYTFGPPGAYLVVRWVTSLPTRPSYRKRRTHEFSVRVKETNGEKWESAPARARTPKAIIAHPPGGFPGPYPTREYVRLSAADLADPPPPGEYPSIKGFLHFIGSSLFVRGGKHDAAWTISGDAKRVRLGTPIFLSAASHADAGSGFDGVNEVICAPDGPPGMYAWSQTTGEPIADYSEKTSFLELRAINDSCKARRRLLEGVWEGIHGD
jgi:hypothetical protein